MKQRNPFARKADPMIWGAWGALAGGIAGIAATALDALPATQSVGGLVAGGFLFPFAVAVLRNWLAERR